jgi:hypothetical protein
MASSSQAPAPTNCCTARTALPSAPWIANTMGSTDLPSTDGDTNPCKYTLAHCRCSSRANSGA